jgi:ADP-heptose:LPS heptosyltransferase
MGFVADSARAPPAGVSAELAALGRDLRPAATGARDFQDTADIVAGLDLVVSVDTAVVHVAGAMGKPVWVLLPTPCDWRWGRGADRSAWYPSARLFRQPAPGDWAGAMAALKTALADRDA